MNGVNEFEFYQDSLIVYEWGMSYINEWDVDESKLYLEMVEGLDSFGIKTKSFDYRLSEDQDTLFIKKHGNDSYGTPILKIKNGYDYFFKLQGLLIELPEKSELIPYEENGIGLDIYVGLRNGKLIVKTGSDKTPNLDEAKREIIKFKAMQESANFQFNLFIDKRVNEHRVDSIKSVLKSTGFKRIFRIYTNDKVDYKKTNWKTELNWFGIYE